MIASSKTFFNPFCVRDDACNAADRQLSTLRPFFAWLYGMQSKRPDSPRGISPHRSLWPSEIPAHTSPVRTVSRATAGGSGGRLANPAWSRRGSPVRPEHGARPLGTTGGPGRRYWLKGRWKCLQGRAHLGLDVLKTRWTSDRETDQEDVCLRVR